MRCIECETVFATGQSRALSTTCATAIQLKLQLSRLQGVFAPTRLHICKFFAATGELSPPESGSPQVTTDPSARIAANARQVA